MSELVTISNLKQAQVAIKEVKQLDDIKRLVDQSEALKGYARAQSLSKEIQQDIAEYNLYATRHMGVISAELEKVKPGKKTIELLPTHGSNSSADNYKSEMPIPDKVYSKTEILAEAGIDIRRANEAEKLAEISEKEFAEIIAEKRDKDELTKAAVVKTVKRKKREEKREEERTLNAEKVTRLDNPLEAAGIFQTIVIDPPWDWGDEGDVNQLGRAKPDYFTMPIDEIEALPINRISDDNCHLYLWVTNRSLPKAFHLIEAWGFRYITCLTWVKPHFGMGNYFRGSTEQVLFAVKGSQPLKRKDVGTHFNAPRGDGHSAKPDEFYELVQSCSYEPYIDVFGRKERGGWAIWGENNVCS